MSKLQSRTLKWWDYFRHGRHLVYRHEYQYCPECENVLEYRGRTADGYVEFERVDCKDCGWSKHRLGPGVGGLFTYLALATAAAIALMWIVTLLVIL